MHLNGSSIYLEGSSTNLEEGRIYLNGSNIHLEGSSTNLEESSIHFEGISTPIVFFHDCKYLLFKRVIENNKYLRVTRYISLIHLYIVTLGNSESLLIGFVR